MVERPVQGLVRRGVGGVRRVFEEEDDAVDRVQRRERLGL